MANVNFDKRTFEKEIGKLDDEMQNKIAMFGTPVEEVRENEIELEVFPNRPDLLNYHGFKRAFLAYLGKKKGLKKYKLKKPEKNFQVVIDSSLKNIRPYTACAIIKKIKFDDLKIKEIIDLQEKLHNTIGRKRKKVAIGIYPLEKIKLPISFKAIEPDKIRFVPLGMERELNGIQILQRHPTGRDYAHLLSGKAKFPIFVDAEDNVLSMPPIINSNSTGKIDENTKEIFVECSGSNFEVLKKCLNILITTMIEMGGEVYQMELKYKKKEVTPNLTSEVKKISLANIEKLLGINLKYKEVKDFLERMGYDYDSKTGEVSIPPWRTDILHEVDLIEDIAIAYGYENFSPEIPEISTIGGENQKEVIKRKISEILAGLGILEVSNYHMTSKNEQFIKMGEKNFDKKAENFIEVEESKTQYNILRRTLTHYILKNFSENVDAEYPQKIFEIGKIFQTKNNKISEKENLVVGITPGNFTDAKQILDYFSDKIGVKVLVKESEDFPDYFIDGRVGEILISNKSIGFVGEVHPKILRNWKLKMPATILEINLEEVFRGLINQPK